jgi:hypothetical protein
VQGIFNNPVYKLDLKGADAAAAKGADADATPGDATSSDELAANQDLLE